MYLLYADESGDLANPDTSVFVVGAIAVHEDAVRPLAGEINETMRRFLGARRAQELELHGSPMRVGGKDWRPVSANKRYSLYEDLMRKLSIWTHESSDSRIECFAVAMDRDHSQSPTETTYGELLYKFDELLRQGRRGGDPHNGVLIADESRYEKTLQAWVELARARRSRPAQDPRRLYAIAETPFFVDSRLTRLMQYADLLTHAVYRGYSANDWNLAALALPALTGSRLLHFTSDAACSCPACAVSSRPHQAHRQR